jgi:hypothetical protein
MSVLPNKQTKRTKQKQVVNSGGAITAKAWVIQASLCCLGSPVIPIYNSHSHCSLFCPQRTVWDTLSCHNLGRALPHLTGRGQGCC